MVYYLFFNFNKNIIFKKLDLVKQIFSTVDPNANGEIDYTEFLTATLNRSNALSVEKLEVAFKMFDTVFTNFYFIEFYNNFCKLKRMLLERFQQKR